MITLVVQAVVGVLLLAFGVLAHRVAGAARGEAAYRAAWRLTATVFLAYGAVYAAQLAFGIVAYRAGAGSGVMSAYLAVAPAGNHARTLLMIVFFVALGALTLRRDPLPRTGRLAAWAVAVGLGVGATLGVLEGRIEAARHFSSTAVADTLGILVLGTVLVAAIHLDRMDRFLWTCLAVHGTRILVGVLYHTVFAWFGAPGGWTPPFWHMHAVRVVLLTVQVAVAAYALRYALTGGALPGMVPRRTLGAVALR